VIDIRRAAGRFRGGDPAAGIETRHAFSFGDHYDPANLRFGLLLACNEERLAPGAGFAEHTHRDTEIVTWVVSGELEHRDGQGHTARLAAGDAQRLGAGRGVRHTERNSGPGELRFVQMWLHPDVFGGPPQYTAVTAPVRPGPGLTLLASGAPDDCPPLRLRQRGAALYVGRPAAAGRCGLPAAPYVYVHVVRGRLRIGGHALEAGDAARLTGEGGAASTAAAGAEAGEEGPAEYLVWAMHGEPGYG
jgi:quercetin 2,3-dioxygenase